MPAMSRAALGIWRDSYEASVTAGSEKRRAMLMVAREFRGLGHLGLALGGILGGRERKLGARLG